MKAAPQKVTAAAKVLKFVYENRKAEIALVVAVVSLAREIVQAATGH